MIPGFEALVEQARCKDPAFQTLSQGDRLAATKEFIRVRRGEILARHREGASGSDIVRALTELADEVVGGVLDFALYSVSKRRNFLQKVALCAQGGYGRAQLNPHSDLDIGLIYEGWIARDVEVVCSYMGPLLWDAGYRNSFVSRTVKEAVALAKRDTKVYTSYVECRLIAGAGAPFAKLTMTLRSMRPTDTQARFAEVKLRERSESLAEQHRDLYSPEPHVKEGAGGLRDYHAALWLLATAFDVRSLDDAVSQEIVTEEERLELAEAIDVLFRVRNELHFLAGKEEDLLTFANQRAVALAFGYIDSTQDDPSRFMEDYYGAARRVRRFLRKVARACDYKDAGGLLVSPRAETAEMTVEDGELYAGLSDPRWFEENPARLMQVFWECARQGAVLAHPSERLVEQNVHLINDSFRSSDLVRRFFLAICNRPLWSGHALRQASAAGVLGRYIPEFAAVQDVVRYADFHTYPVDEHTIRAVEALSALASMKGPVGNCLRNAFEHLTDPYILVLALLFHDLGKASGEEHVEEGVVLSRRICERIGLANEDAERIEFLVRHHMLMSNVGMYRDSDDPAVVDYFAKIVKTEDRLRALFILTYADMTAVGPNVWNDWKGTLLLKLYLRTERALIGRAQTPDEQFWKQPKADDVRARLPEELKGKLEEHLKDLGERYFAAFSAEHIAWHLECIDEAEKTGMCIRCDPNEETEMSEVVICWPDHRGMFAEIAGCFASQVIDVNNAALFTRSNGMALDSFTVTNAHRRRPLTKTQFEAVEKILRGVLSGERPVEEFLEQSRRRLYGLLQAPVPVPTRVTFDNESSQMHTVIDIEAGDRTGLLYDMARVLRDMNVNVVAARIVTDARRVRDSFYALLDGTKIEDKEFQAELSEALKNAIHPRPAVEITGDIA